MAGVTKLFKMPCTFETTKKGEIFLRGERAFLFSDFNLKAPQRMMGMIKVNEKLFVQFNLSLKLDVNRW
jgi:ABC-type methionine transport system ATPase subunit